MLYYTQASKKLLNMNISNKVTWTYKFNNKAYVNQ